MVVGWGGTYHSCQKQEYRQSDTMADSDGEAQITGAALTAL